MDQGQICGVEIVELQVTNSPFNQEQTELLTRLLPTLNAYQRIWLSGYLTAAPGESLAVSGSPAAGTGTEASGSAAPAAAPSPAVSREVTVLFGSQTDNCRGLAKKLAKKLEEGGFAVTLSAMSDFKPNNLKKVENLLVLVSTHGEGEPPDNALAFHEFLHSKRAPGLNGLRYSVLALGDTSYEYFCQTGKDFDKRLEELGGERLVPRVDCDVDFDEPAAGWMNSVIGALSAESGSASAAAGIPVTAPIDAGGEPQYSRSNPFYAEVLENLNLNGRGSDRETRHMELSLEGSGLTYEPGDSLGVYPENHPELVAELIEAMGWDAEERVTAGKSGTPLPLRDALTRYYEITVLTKPLLASIAATAPASGIGGLLESGREEELRSYLAGSDLLDLVRDYGLRGLCAPELTGLLRRIPPRLYSISSSPTAHEGEVHITVRAVRYEERGRSRYGVCSVGLAERVRPGDKLPVFIQSNSNFKLPEDPQTPIILIGPGTGVAPFRSFLAEREETGVSGKSWLFYGDQHFSTDFLYQTEWQRWLKDGVLTRMDVAFSRDTDRKVYVQHRMLEKSAELYQWLKEGAAVYVCGDEKRMAHDVHAALVQILREHGGLAAEAAEDYLTELVQQKRYQRDVY